MAKLSVLVFGTFMNIFVCSSTLGSSSAINSNSNSDSPSVFFSSKSSSGIKVENETNQITLDNIMETDTAVIHSYHFHTYFYHWDEHSQSEALNLREKIQMEITNGNLKECRNNFVNFAPRGPHLLGNYETCCNATSVANAISFFMQNRGNLSVLFHPLTRWELLDHTDRAMFLGPQVRMNTSFLSVDLFDDVDNCLDDEIEYSDPDLFIV